MSDEIKKGNKEETTTAHKRTYAYIRIIAGGYLLFTVYDMLRDSSLGTAPDTPKVLIPTAIIFSIIGTLFIIFAVKRILQLRE